MTQEMKIHYGDVETAVSKIENASDAFETTLIKDIASGNELDVVKKLNELNSMLEEVGLAYKKVLKENNQSVIRSIHNIETADQSLSSSIMAR
ncbi:MULTISPECIES: DUF5344 family protein [Bacillus]|uniref:DUF5344 family protein n=1 Tax=Bacillus TaxID=1386 RepID=UPI0002D95254|nr:MULTISPECIES: DUF5344 family protein [Bacillus]